MKVIYIYHRVLIVFSAKNNGKIEDYKVGSYGKADSGNASSFVLTATSAFSSASVLHFMWHRIPFKPHAALKLLIDYKL